MDELSELLKKNLEVSEETLKILKRMRRSEKIKTAMQIFYWFLIIGSMVGAYYYLEPAVRNMIETWRKVIGK